MRYEYVSWDLVLSENFIFHVRKDVRCVRDKFMNLLIHKVIKLIGI